MRLSDSIVTRSFCSTDQSSQLTYLRLRVLFAVDPCKSLVNCGAHGSCVPRLGTCTCSGGWVCLLSSVDHIRSTTASVPPEFSSTVDAVQVALFGNCFGSNRYVEP